MLDEFQQNQLRLINIKHAPFYKFCYLLSEIRADIRDKSKWSYLKIKLMNTYDFVASTYELQVTAAIEERWAMFLLSL